MSSANMADQDPCLLLPANRLLLPMWLLGGPPLSLPLTLTQKLTREGRGMRGTIKVPFLALASAPLPPLSSMIAPPPPPVPTAAVSRPSRQLSSKERTWAGCPLPRGTWVAVEWLSDDLRASAVSLRCSYSGNSRYSGPLKGRGSLCRTPLTVTTLSPRIVPDVWTPGHRETETYVNEYH